MLSTFSRTFKRIRRNRKQIPLQGFDPIPNHEPKVCKTALEAVQCIKSRDRVFLHEIAASPMELIKALASRAPELEHVETTGIFPFGIEVLERDEEVYKKAFVSNPQFCGPPSRKGICRPRPHTCYVPINLSEVGSMLRSPDYPIDVALLTLSPPNKDGYCSYGPSVSTGKPGAESAKIIVAEINPNLPFTLGKSLIHWSHLDYVYYTNRQIPQFPSGKITPIQKKIANNIAELIPDGACLQAGFGGVPDAVLSQLTTHKHLGVHTEMFAEGLIDLLNSGAIDGSKKAIDVGKITASFVMGTDRLYKTISNNPDFYFTSSEYTNNPYVIAQNPNMVAINAALQVDLTGQVCADSMGSRQFSGVGGQVDFVTGASLSENGRAIIALPSTAKKDTVSRIVTSLTPGSSVTTSRWFGATIVTEYGVADLWGLNTRQRAQALISIAHPKFREQLARDADEIYGVYVN